MFSIWFKMYTSQENSTLLFSRRTSAYPIFSYPTIVFLLFQDIESSSDASQHPITVVHRHGGVILRRVDRQRANRFHYPLHSSNGRRSYERAAAPPYPIIQ